MASMTDKLPLAERIRLVNEAAENVRAQMIVWAAEDIFRTQTPTERWLTERFAICHGWAS